MVSGARQIILRTNYDPFIQVSPHLFLKVKICSPPLLPLALYLSTVVPSLQNLPFVSSLDMSPCACSRFFNAMHFLFSSVLPQPTYQLTSDSGTRSPRNSLDHELQRCKVVQEAKKAISKCERDGRANK